MPTVESLSRPLAADLRNGQLAGCLSWQRDGLNEPERVRLATSGYAQEMDEVGQFVDEHCERGDFVAGAGDLFAAFQAAYPDSRLSQHAFGARLRAKGFVNSDPVTGKEYRTNKGKKAWHGLRLRTGEVQKLLDGLKAKNARAQ